MPVTIPAFIGLINDDNKPILIYVPPGEADDVNKVLKYNTFANIALDYFESQLFTWSSMENHFTIKSFFEIEGVSVYGMLIKPTGLKIIIGFDALTVKNDEKKIHAVFEAVKRLYVRVKCNPLMDSHDADNNALIETLEEKFDKYFSSDEPPSQTTEQA